ncbi:MULTISPECIES: 3-deoxy-D-manno-octulosonic acid kinase [Ferrimonas]|uniref:3-deoxy-D-manno-octulosonic acid kinase n=1 Tax=Ferrimonas TaxID=44011 RepID=UPI00041699C3|nr:MULTISPECIES: 3-deoxy-D-manno-octulosonic acid kinase [Ferrimonas]USD37752.1 3-deoxy-D-manno-octulosonic acid kinase [Ferrimonas sp. SCSIO 43195]
MQLTEHRENTLLLADDSPAKECWFDREWLQRGNRIDGHSDASGRNPALFLKIDGGHFVLRHYYRGGLPGKLIEDAYLWPGLNKTRAYRELKLLEQIQALQLPACRPVAARIERQGFSYRADLITERLMGCQDLVGALSQASLSESRWIQLGQVLARFHQAGVYHADLNARNILLDSEQFYLIDFDRGEMRKPDRKWQQANLDRLQRSLRKEAQRVSGLKWQESDWSLLLKGYRL